MQVSVSPDAVGHSEHPATDCSRGALQPELPEQLHGPLQCLSWYILIQLDPYCPVRRTVRIHRWRTY